MHQMINFEILKSRQKLLTLLSTTGSVMQVVKFKKKPSNCFLSPSSKQININVHPKNKSMQVLSIFSMQHLYKVNSL